MKRLIFGLAVLGVIALAIACNDSSAKVEKDTKAEKMPTYQMLGYESKVEYGDHLVSIIGCDDCHTPKMMTDNGPVPDLSKRLMGHPKDVPAPSTTDKGMLAKGNMLTNGSLTAFLGPWGVTFAANLTPHETGLGNWSEAHFTKAMREGLHKGLDGGRQILPPMPWFNFAKMTDDELSAVFAYLKSLPALDNQVPEPIMFEKPKTTAMN